MYNELIKDQYLEFEEGDQTFVFFIDLANQLQFVGSFIDEIDYLSPNVKSFFDSLKNDRNLRALNLTVDFDETTQLYFVNGAWEMTRSAIEFYSLISLIKDELIFLKKRYQEALELDLIYVKRQAR
jgi:hypothetical protein